MLTYHLLVRMALSYHFGTTWSKAISVTKLDIILETLIPCPFLSVILSISCRTRSFVLFSMYLPAMKCSVHIQLIYYKNKNGVNGIWQGSMLYILRFRKYEICDRIIEDIWLPCPQASIVWSKLLNTNANTSRGQSYLFVEIVCGVHHLCLLTGL